MAEAVDDKELLIQSGTSRKSSGASVGADDPHPGSRRSSKRLSRQASMERHSLDEQEVRRPKKSEKRRSCPDYFGVKSYLHHFYDSGFFKDPSIYEEDDYRYLLNPGMRRRRCRPVWWKVSTWVGANLMIFGLVGILVGHLVPQKPIIIETDSTNQVLIDKGASPHNTMLDMCKIVGLVLFCVGGTTLALALLFPSFFYQYCDEERHGEEAIRVRYGEENKPPPLSPIEMTIPASAKMKNVQPERNGEESLVTKDGLIKVKD